MNMQPNEFYSQVLQRILSLDPDENSYYSQRQLKILAIIQICSGFLSVIGSLLILYHIWTNPYSADTQKRNGRIQRGDALKLTFERIMIALSLADLNNGLSSMTASFPVPRGSPGFWHPIGNQTSCTAQGLFAHLAAIVLYFSASLAIYFALAITPKISDETIKRQFEPFLLIVPVVISIVGAVVGLCLNMFNPVLATKICWIAPYPFGCDHDGDYSNCTRGKNANEMVLALVLLGFLCYAIIIICMAYIIIASWRQQNILETRYSYSSSETNPHHYSFFRKRNNVERTQEKNSKLRRIATQGLLYIFVISLSWFATVLNIVFVINGHKAEKFGLSVVEKITFPLQGLLNMLVYIRPRYIDIRTQNPSIGWSAVVIRIFSRVSIPNNRLEFKDLSNRQHMSVPAYPIQQISQAVSSSCPNDSTSNVMEQNDANTERKEMYQSQVIHIIEKISEVVSPFCPNDSILNVTEEKVVDAERNQMNHSQLMDIVPHEVPEDSNSDG
jgi:hypothetical protein